MLATARKNLKETKSNNQIKNLTKKQNKRKYFCCFEFITESEEAIETK
jgi:hypothetical protein